MKRNDAIKLIDDLKKHVPENARLTIDAFQNEASNLAKTRDNEIDAAKRDLARREDQANNVFDRDLEKLTASTRDALTKIQYQCLESGELEAAMATYTQLALLDATVSSPAKDAVADPGTLVNYERIGETFAFNVVGSVHGSVWGTDVYTSDSALAVAAVHAGAIEVGESGVVTVEMVDMSEMTIRGSSQHGVLTSDWSGYHVGYRFV